MKAFSQRALRPGYGPAPAEPEEDLVDFSTLLRVLWIGKWRILLITLLAVAIGAWYVFSVAIPLYTSSAVLVLGDREQPQIDVESLTGIKPESDVDTEIVVVGSRELAGEVVRQLDLIEDPEFNPVLRPVEPYSVTALKRYVLGPPPELSSQAVFDATVDELLLRMSTSQYRGDSVQISARTTSPGKSAEIANRLGEIYIADQLERKFTATEQAMAWLSDRVTGLKGELEAAVTELKDFSASTELISPESLALRANQLKELRNRLEESRSTLADIKGTVGALESADPALSPTAVAALTGDGEVQRLAEGVEDGTFPRSALDQRLERFLDGRRILEQRESEKISVLESSIARLEDEIHRQSGELVRLEQLEREVAATTLTYESFLSRLKELSVQQGTQTPEARLVSRAVPRPDPTSPKTVLVLALSGLLGLIVGSSVLLMHEHFRSTFRSSDELEQFAGLPVLGEVPKSPAARPRELLGHLLDKSSSTYSEAVRNFRTSLLISNVDSPPKLIMLTSSIPGEGKTTQSLSLAHSLALMGKRVLIIEADLRRARFSQYFGVSDDHPGLVAVVAEGRALSETVVSAKDVGFHILVGDRIPVNPADFFSSRRFADLLAAARDEYDAVIIDTPPVLPVPDARVIGQLVDAIVYVVRWDRTLRAQVAAGLRVFDGANLKAAGLLLSQVNPRKMKVYGYGAYGTYGGYHTN